MTGKLIRPPRRGFMHVRAIPGRVILDPHNSSETWEFPAHQALALARALTTVAATAKRMAAEERAKEGLPRNVVPIRRKR